MDQRQNPKDLPDLQASINEFLEHRQEMGCTPNTVRGYEWAARRTPSEVTRRLSTSRNTVRTCRCPTRMSPRPSNGRNGPVNLGCGCWRVSARSSTGRNTGTGSPAPSAKRYSQTAQQSWFASGTASSRIGSQALISDILQTGIRPTHRSTTITNRYKWWRFRQKAPLYRHKSVQGQTADDNSYQAPSVAFHRDAVGWPNHSLMLPKRD